jgi:hypothetical protein
MRPLRVSVAELNLRSITNEDAMCWEIDYRFFEEQKKAQEEQTWVDQLLKDANKQAEQAPDETPAKEIATAK